MPAPSDNVLLTKTVLNSDGSIPTTHSCDVLVVNGLGATVLTRRAMTFIEDSVYIYQWSTSPSLPVGPYLIIYYAVKDGIAAPAIAETLYIETGSTSAALIQQIWYTTFCNKSEVYTYDSQGRTETITVDFSTTDDFSSPVAEFLWNFTWDADNNIESYTVIRTI